MTAVAGTLVVCSTPIGNLADVSERLRETLAGVDVVYAEDTRRTRRLLAHLGVDTPVRSYFVGNEAERAAEISHRLQGGAVVAIVTDAGTPGISDPGYTAVRAALEAGAQVTVVPGPSAVTAALVVSGLAAERFIFEGFLPRKQGERQERLERLRNEPRTIVLFSTKTRLVRDLTDLARSLGGGRRCAVVRELTKLHEEIWRGDVEGAVAEWSGREPRGEFTVVVAGGQAASPEMSMAISDALRLIEGGMTRSAAVRRVAAAVDVSRRELYEAVIRAT